ncbi:MAG: 5'-nucleotidase C-terminal domain-containing protein [Bacteroidales bacterium]|nr:5'-nucleotidase C-terminal domain-containing protein [Bacteroidales bacterium]
MNQTITYRFTHRFVVTAFLTIATTIFLCGCRSTSNLPLDSHIVSKQQIHMDGPADSTTNAIIEPYRIKLKQLMARPIGHCDKDMEALRPESDLMRFMADALLHEAQQVCRELNLPQPVICLQNTGGIRATLPGTILTVQNIFEISPFENSVVIAGATGQQLISILQHVAERGGEPLSGVQIVINDDKLESATVNGHPVDNNKIYWIATNSYIAQGGDGFSTMTECEIHDTGFFIRDLLIRHIEGLTAKGIKVHDPGNIRIIKK